MVASGMTLPKGWKSDTDTLRNDVGEVIAMRGPDRPVVWVAGWLRSDELRAAADWAEQQTRRAA